jgi:catechol 2,3-dioxygenase-like lactoylglutathione lyase family enzyme
MRAMMIVLYVPNMAEALAFYRDGLGLEVMSESPGWSRLKCGDSSIGLHHIYAGVTERPVPYAGLNLEVDALEPAIERAVAHGARLVELREPDRAGLPRLAVMRAPGGNGFELRQSV